jgi:hypothetical protein
LLAGSKDFEELAVNAVRFDLGGDLAVLICDLDDLIRIKRGTRRPKDRIELEILGAVREERDQAERAAQHRADGS